MNPYKYMLTFRETIKGSLYVTHHPSIKFFVSRSIQWEREFLVEPLTVSRFIRAIAVNLVVLNYWKMIRLLVWRLHAFELSEGAQIAWRDFKPYRVVRLWIEDLISWFQFPEPDPDKDFEPKSDEELMELYRAFQYDMNDFR